MRHKFCELFGDELALRIGINTGEVVAGHGREGHSFVTGDAVNIAARLEQTAAPGEIVVGERTASAAIDAFDFSEPETIDVKGRRGIVCRDSSVSWMRNTLAASEGYGRRLSAEKVSFTLCSRPIARQSKTRDPGL